LSSATWPDLDGRAPLVVVPLGSVEQHGRHLPLATDTVVAQAVAEDVVPILDGAVPSEMVPGKPSCSPLAP
jgi:creatinine amidohydrolase